MTPIERFFREESLRIMRTHSHPRGAFAVLDVLRERKRAGDDWTSRDLLQAATGQRDVRTRISELRRKWGWTIEHNGKAGALSAYRLVDEVRP